MFKVYRAYIKPCYNGEFLIGAKNADDAMDFIKTYKKSDLNNEMDSRGLEDNINENDVCEDLFANKRGIVFSSLYYSG